MMLQNNKITPNFWLHEFIHGTEMPDEAVMLIYRDMDASKLPRLGYIAYRLEEIRIAAKRHFGDSFRGIEITCGIRVKAWELLKGRSGNSQHCEYWAVDFRPICDDEKYEDIFEWIFNKFEPIWIGGFAKNDPKLSVGKKGFIHADCRPYKARWTY